MDTSDVVLLFFFLMFFGLIALIVILIEKPWRRRKTDDSSLKGDLAPTESRKTERKPHDVGSVTLTEQYAKENGLWVCPNCETMMDDSVSICVVCGVVRK